MGVCDLDYTMLGEQYIRESFDVGSRMQMARAAGDKSRLAMLRDMREELRTVGTELIQRGSRFEKNLA